MKKKSKPTKNTTTKEESSRKKPTKRKKATNWKGIFMVGALVLVMISFILSSIPSNPTAMKPKNTPTNNTAQNNTTKSAVEFKNEGNLTFLNKDGTSIANIDIEVADTEYDRAQGLMHRRYMKASQGMLFIMEELEIQSFYMRNTHISLDILYVNENKEIVSIQKNTVPLSETSLFSEGEALYVVEVNAGYCDQHGIGPGDKVEFELN